MWEMPKTRYLDSSSSKYIEVHEIVVNIGGLKQVLSGDVLNRYPDTRLAELVNCYAQNSDNLSFLCDDYDAINGEFYFDRDPDSFKCIIELYYFGEIHIKRGICPICFAKEMEFWKVDSNFLDECCRSHLNQVEDELAQIAKDVKMILDVPSATRRQRYKTFLWKLMENPESSLPARVIAVVSFLLILISSVVMCVGTVPDLLVEDAEGNHVEHPTLDGIETTCISWFTAEYITRLVSSPNKVRFVLSFMNLIDLLAILPFYVVLTLENLGTSVMKLSNVQQAVQALRVMRIARVFKLARHSSGLQTLTYALKSSFTELGLLFLYMGIGIFVFSALAYTMEQSHSDTMFTSIPQSFWWAIITMTTVGYGDTYPKTTLGRCNAAVSFLCGVIAIALPIHPIINNFVIFYNKQKILETAVRHELELLALQSSEGIKSQASRKACPSSRITVTSHSDTYLLFLDDCTDDARPPELQR